MNKNNQKTQIKNRFKAHHCTKTIKLMVMLIFFSVFLIGNVSAVWEWDNVRSYNEDIKKITITNFLGLGKDIATIQLNTPLEYSVPIGYNKVAEFTINNLDNYSNVFNDMEFFDLNKKGNKFERNFDYKYKTIIQVPDYKTVCDKGFKGNGTVISLNCREQQIGLKDKVIWTEINTVEGLLKGNIIIGIFTEVKEGDKVEWIPTLFGERLTEWAVWTADLNVDLITYYKLDDDGSPVIDSVENNNGTNVGATTGVAGLINNSYEFDGVGDRITAGLRIFPNDTSDFSVFMWINLTTHDATNGDGLISQHESAQPGRVNFLVADNGSLSMSANPIGTMWSPDIIGTGVWTMVGMTRESNNLTIFINNTNQGSKTFGSAFFDENSEIAHILDNNNSNLHGLIDEIGIWNRSLSASEITQLYNNGSGITHRTVFPSTVTLNLPIDNFETTNQTIVFNGTVVASTNLIINVSLFIDGTLNETNSSGINNTDYIFTKTLEFGSHNWTYESCDNESLCSNATERSFEIIQFTENNITFNTEVLETSFQDFELNITTIASILSVSASLNYDGTLDTSTVTCSNSECSIKNTIDIPLISLESENKSFFWEVTVFDGTESISINSTVSEQNISRIHLEECNATFTVQTLNFTAYDEQNLSRIDPFLFDVTFDQWLGNGSVKRSSNFTNSSTSEINLCISPTDETFFIDAVIEYDEAGNESLYTLRNYYFQNDTINNVSQDVFLYLLQSTFSTSFILAVQDDSLLPVEGVLVEINRFYPGTDKFRIVQIAKTDDLGKSVGFFETEIADYKFLITLNNQTLLETGIQKVVPETSPFTLTFNIGDPLGEPWSTQNEISNLNSNLTWNDTSGFVTYVYIDSSGNLTLARLLVIQESLINSTANSIICNETSSLSSSTLSCNVGNDSGFYIASSFIARGNGEGLDKQFTFQIETLSSVVGLLGLFYAWFLILIASFMFKFSEIAGIWAVTITVFLVNLTGLISFGGVFVTGTIAVAIILTWIMEK